MENLALNLPLPEQNLPIVLRLQDRLVTEKQFAEIIVRSKEDGSQVLLGDIARIELGTENYSSTARRNGQAAAAIAIYQMPGSNALEVAATGKNSHERNVEKIS